MIRADLHIHTKYSSDASIQPKMLVDQLYSHSTVKAVAVTDHNTLEGYYKTKELAKPYTDIAVIAGAEIHAAEGEVIVLGIEELPTKPWSVPRIIDFARAAGGVTVAPHPYRGYGLGELTRKYSLDAIEVLNGASSPQANRLAENLAKTMQLPGTAGSDAHAADELWSVYTEVQASLDVDEILKAVKNGLVKAVSAGRSIHF